MSKNKSSKTEKAKKIKLTKAEKFQKLIIGYVENKHNLEKLIDFLIINKAHLSDILTINTNAFSPLHDAMMLPFKDINGGNAESVSNFSSYNLAFEKSFGLVNLFIQTLVRPELPKDYKAKLLQSFNENCLTLLQCAIQTSNSKILQLVVDMLKTNLSKKEYSVFLTEIHNSSFGLVTDAIKSNDIEIVKIVLNELKSVLSREQYLDMLKHINKAGFTLLQSAITSGNLDIIKLIFKELKGELSKEQYAMILQNVNNYGFTLAHSAIDTGNSKIVEFVLNELKYCVTNKYPSILLKATNDGYNLFHVAGIASKEITCYVMKEIQEIFGFRSEEVTDWMLNSKTKTGNGFKPGDLKLRDAYNYIKGFQDDKLSYSLSEYNEHIKDCLKWNVVTNYVNRVLKGEDKSIKAERVNIATQVTFANSIVNKPTTSFVSRLGYNQSSKSEQNLPFSDRYNLDKSFQQSPIERHASSDIDKSNSSIEADGDFIIPALAAEASFNKHAAAISKERLQSNKPRTVST